MTSTPEFPTHPANGSRVPAPSPLDATDAARGGRRRSLFLRGEDALAHAVYGLILTIATLGELIHHHVTAGVAIAWLLGAGAVLLAAHLFSDVLAHMAANRQDTNWRDILTVGREDVAVTVGSVASAVLMTVAALAGLDSRDALVACVGLGLVAVAVLSFIASSAHRPFVRVSMAGAATILGVVIVALEITF